jgi:hypothetical protein
MLAGCSFTSRGLTPAVGEETPEAGADVAPDDVARDRAPDRSADGAPDLPPPQVGGSRCLPGGNSCASGFCVDGVCCDRACAGTCEACSASKTGGSDGVCKAVPAGMNPDGECHDQGMTSCKSTGVCDGAGACAVYPKGTACGGAACTMGSLTTAAMCDGKGTCVPQSPSACPGNFACADATTCKTTCASDADCTAPMGCDPASGKCSVMKKARGEACTAAGECLTGFCADGVCCSAACTGRCRACVKELTGRDTGTCSDVMAGVKPTRPAECPVQKATCGNSGLCDGAGGCQQFPDQTECGTYCCGGGGGGPRTCHLLCGGGMCNVQSGTVATSCSDNNPCTDDSCMEVGSNAECRHGGGCGGNQCCCQQRNDPPMCINQNACERGFIPGTCLP